MGHDRYTRHMRKASAAVQHLGRALRGRAFFVFRDRSDPSEPQIIACHPPLSDDALLRALQSDHLVCEPVSEDSAHHAFVGIARDADFENPELAHEMAAVAAQSLAGEITTTSASASFDDGTGLPDREAFMARLDECLSAPREAASQAALLVVDLDHFHRVMARFGDAGGQELVKVVAFRLLEALDGRVEVSSLGGDRFSLLIPNTTRESAETTAISVASSVHEALRRPIRIQGEDIFVTASIGISLGAGDQQPSTMMREADLGIALANEAGGASTRVFHAGMHNVPAHKLLRDRDIRLAVTREEFEVFFQPIVSANHGGALHAFEALLRWNNPEEGLLPPSTFLDVLNETGLVEVVGRRVIRDACVHAARWMALSGSLVPVSVNVAPIQLYADDFSAHIAHTLADTNLPPEGLILELTEHAFIEDAASARTALRAVRELGVRVLIDDFGTGYSSLSYLHELPITGIKLDRMWFRAIEKSDTKREIVRTIIGLAHYMHMDVVAEGIESPTQLLAARELKCDFAQGYCFGRPFDAEHATRYLAQTLSKGMVA